MTTPGTRHSKAAEIVSLVERLRYMQLFRLVVAAVAALSAVFAPEAVGATVSEVAAGTAVFLLVSLFGEAVWRLWRRRGLTLFGALLIGDGFYLAWLTYTTGGTTSPLRYLIILHLVAVALLASYRTGLKLALWHSLLLFVVFHAQRGGLLEPNDGAFAAAGSEFQHLATFAGSFWLVAIATATFSAVNERELRRRRVDLEALARLATDLESATDQRAAAELLLDNVCDTFGFARAVVVLPLTDGEFSLAAARGCPPLHSAHGRAASDSVLQRAVEDRATQLVSTLDHEADAWLATLLPSAGNLVVVPMSAEHRAVALLVAEHSLRPNSRIERRVVSMVERFADHAALALRSASLLEQLERLAATDGLTLIANRRTFDTTLEREISRARRTDDNVSLVMLDIDGFKPLNDLHGHQTGDEILRQIASILADHCRDFDTAARYGGEEFVLILPGCPADEAVGIAERLREVIVASETIVPVTVSAGVATFPSNAIDDRALLQAADEALYEAKRLGRDRVASSRRRAPIAVTSQLAGS